MEEEEGEEEGIGEQRQKAGNKIKNQNQGESEIEEVIKVTIAKKAETVIADLVQRINDGFEGGRVSRQDLITWVMMRFAEHCGEAEIRQIRTDHFDEIALLELCLKKSRQSGSLPPELRKLLLAQAGLDRSEKSKQKVVDSKVHQ